MSSLHQRVDLWRQCHSIVNVCAVKLCEALTSSYFSFSKIQFIAYFCVVYLLEHETSRMKCESSIVGGKTGKIG